MKITMFGTGYVGLVTGTCFAEMGNDVLCVDVNGAKVRDLQAGKIPIFEPGLDEIVQGARGKNLHFHTQVEDAIRDANIVFVCVGTPTKAAGIGAGRAADLRYIELAARTIAKVSEGPKIIVEKSTIPVRTAEALRTILSANSESGLPFSTI